MGKQNWYPIDVDILVVMIGYASPYRLGGRGRGISREPDLGEENAIFLWQEIVWCFWATSVFLGGKLRDHCHF